MGTPDRLRRPMLKTGLAWLHRDPATVQFGLDPDRAVLFTGMDAELLDALERLDGVTDPVELRTRIPAERLDALLGALAGADLLEDAAVTARGWRELPLPSRDRLAPDLASLTLTHPGPDAGKRALARRLRAHVEVRGGGRVGATTAGLLTAAGVGRVRVLDSATTAPADLAPGGLSRADLGTERGPAATRAATRLAPYPPEQTPRAGAPDVVLFADSPPLPGATDALLREGVPHLVASVRDTAGVVGPLVLPGVSSCLRCADLRRADRDRGWLRLAPQLADPPRTGGTRVSPCDVVLAAAVAAHAALQVLAFLDTGSAPAVDGTLHLELPGGAVRRRSWSRHPSCGCAWADAPAS